MPTMTAKRVFCGLKKQHQRVVWMLQIHEKEAAQAGWIFADTVLLRNSLPSGFGFQTGRHCLGINYRSCCWAAVMSAIISLFQLLWKMRINCVVLIAFGRLYKRYRLWAILWLFVGHWCACISIIRVTLLFRPPDSCHLCHVFLIKLLFQVSTSTALNICSNLILILPSITTEIQFLCVPHMPPNPSSQLRFICIYNFALEMTIKSLFFFFFFK